VRASGEKRSRSSFVIWLVLYESRPSMTIPDEPLTISMTRITFLQIGHRQQGSSTAYSDTTHCSSFKPFARLACPARVVAAQPQRREDLAAAVNCWFGVESSSASCACVMARCSLSLVVALSICAVGYPLQLSGKVDERSGVVCSSATRADGQMSGEQRKKQTDSHAVRMLRKRVLTISLASAEAS
jgi:hypothetical protein